MEEKTKAMLKMLGIDPEVLETDSPEEALDTYLKVEDIKDTLDDFRKELRLRMFDIAEDCVEPDEKGSYKLRFADGRGFKKEARTRVTVDKDKVKDLSESKGIKLTKEKPKLADNLDLQEKAFEVLKEEYPEAIEIEEEVDEQELEQAFYNGEITEEEFEEVVNRKTNYALRKYT